MSWPGCIIRALPFIPRYPQVSQGAFLSGDVRMKRARLLVHVGLALVGAAVVAAASMTLVRAFNPQPDPPGDAYALIGLLRQETIEVTVSNYGMPNVGFPPGPCRGAMTLYDAQGNVVAMQDFSLRFGES